MLYMRLMHIGRDGVSNIDYAIDIFNSVYKSNCLTSLEESVDGNTLINSISRFEEPIPDPIQVRHKGCGRGRRPPKSATRFKSTREYHVQCKISAKSRKCGECSDVGHNRQRCISRAVVIRSQETFDITGSQEPLCLNSQDVPVVQDPE